MVMKELIIVFTSIFLATYLFSQENQVNNSNVKPPNSVLILVDDAALQDFGIYGGEAYTPNIDKFYDGKEFTTSY